VNALEGNSVNYNTETGITALSGRGHLLLIGAGCNASQNVAR
jgi:hypothetical protein